MAGFEIKTERDTLRRLPRQVQAYGRVFDTCNIVTAERHLDAALDLVPDWWGVIAYVNQDCPLAFHQVRASEANRTLDPETLVRLLWRDEVRAALALIGAKADPQESRASMWQHLLDLIDLSRLRDLVRSALLHRDPAAARLPSAAGSRRPMSALELARHEAEVVGGSGTPPQRLPTRIDGALGARGDLLVAPTESPPENSGS